MIDYAKILTELEEERAACQYVYAQIMQDNSMRRKPYRVSEVKNRKIIATMPEFQ